MQLAAVPECLSSKNSTLCESHLTGRQSHPLLLLEPGLSSATVAQPLPCARTVAPSQPRLDAARRPRPPQLEPPSGDPSPNAQLRAENAHRYWRLMRRTCVHGSDAPASTSESHTRGVCVPARVSDDSRCPAPGLAGSQPADSPSPKCQAISELRPGRPAAGPGASVTVRQPADSPSPNC